MAATSQGKGWHASAVSPALLDETGSASVGDWVKIMETRPLSKEKRWRLVEVLTRASSAPPVPGEEAEQSDIPETASS